MKKKTDFDAIFEFGLFTEKHTLIEAITDHPFKFVLTNLKEINLGATIKKLNKEELIQMIEKFFNKMSQNFKKPKNVKKQKF